MSKEKAIYVLEMNNPFMGGEKQRNLSEALDIAVKALEGKHYERAILIPDGATNGDVIKSIFPNIDDHFSNVIDLKLWWKSTYKGVKE